MRVYSPSQTTAFMDNPVYWELCYREGWHPITLGYPDRALVAGGGFSEGVLSHYRQLLSYGGVLTGEPYPSQLHGDLAAEYIKDRLARLESKRFQWKDEADPSDLAKQVKVAVERYIAQDPLPKGWLFAVEPSYKDFGNARPDLILRSPLLTPADIKFKQTLDEDRRAQAVSEYAYSWQFMHYVWATAGFYGEPCQNSCLILVRMRPFNVWVEFFPVDPELQLIWFVSARSAWAVMAAMDGYPEDLLALIAEYAAKGQGIPPWHTFKWYGRYGRDAMAGAILDYKLDEGLMTQSYIKMGKA